MIQGIILTIGIIAVLVVMMVVFTIHSIIKLFFPEKESQKKIQQPTVIDMGTGSWIWIPKVEKKIIAVEEDETKKVSTVQGVITTIWEKIKDIIGMILIAIIIVFGIPVAIILAIEYVKKLL